VSGFRPQAVLGTGGYVCVPVVLAARRRRLPVVLLEQNRLPGRAIHRLAPLASSVAVSFADTAEHLPPGRSVFTGNPVRAAFQGPRPELPTRPAVLVMGGSQGARHLNRALVAALPELLRRLPELEVTHLTGERDEARVVAEARAQGLDRDPRYRLLPFSDRVAELASSSRLVVMRAGGSSLAEMACLGRPLVLVPYPHAGNHQLANAEAFASAGAALVLEDSELSPERLAQLILSVLTEEGRAEQMARSSLTLARPGAALEVARLLLSTAANV
jgi:UDP-N-acetylglucosamine--N-acetylmuramyl-(pentapeptide) pyrophosphoryl-undecaprenol N-acetylglucosamine transferase